MIRFLYFYNWFLFSLQSRMSGSKWHMNSFLGKVGNKRGKKEGGRVSKKEEKEKKKENIFTLWEIV